MKTTRLEAFSDGVIAIIITIMVLELKVPQGQEIEALAPLGPIFVAHVLSFIYLGIYWSNHHHMLQATEKVNGKILWANLHLLFWLSLIPFATGWMGQNGFAALPIAIYGFVLLLSAVAYTILQSSIVNHETDENIALAKAVAHDKKGMISILLYLIAIPTAFLSIWISAAIYFAVATMWLIPSRKIEQTMDEQSG
ncbi:MAG: TMEM175 family protein [Pyrinomonadaceae bacterium]